MEGRSLSTSQANNSGDLLLGNDVLCRLGFAQECTNKIGPMTDLLSTNSATYQVAKRESNGAVGSDSSTTEVANLSTQVKIIQATRVPAQHFKLIRVNVMDPAFGKEVCLFESHAQQVWIGQDGCSASGRRWRGSDTFGRESWKNQTSAA